VFSFAPRRFWKCPNGDTACKYKHALPAGYTYRSKKQRDAETAAKLAEVDNAVSMEELIEEEVRRPAAVRCSAVQCSANAEG
jgi:hypothetical protein